MEYDAAKARQLLFDLLERCREAKDRVIEVATLRELDNITGLHQQHIHTTEQAPAPLSEQDRQELQQAARRATLKLTSDTAG